MWRALHERRHRGTTVRWLMETTGGSRATVYRDLEALEAAGAGLRREQVNGEARVFADIAAPPPLSPSPAQWAALHLARRCMGPLEGTGFIQELDSLLAPSQAHDRSISLPKTPLAQHPKISAALDAAIRARRRVQIRYRGTRDSAAKPRTVEPAALRLAGRDLYVIAYDLERSAWRTFKCARIRHAALLEQPCAKRRPDYDEQALFGKSVKTWSGDELDVAIRLHPAVARYASEYPLIANQTLEDQPGGSLIVRARVSGHLETARWVLGWGKHAEALEPAILRETVQDELAGALGRYRPGLAKTRGKKSALEQPVSHKLRRGGRR